MKILIDNQRGIQVDHTLLRGGDNEVVAVLDFDSTYHVLNTWKELDTTRRGFRYGGQPDDHDPSTIITAYVAGSGHLTIGDVDPFTTSSLVTLNAYSLEDLAAALPISALQWGEEIGESAP